MCDMLIIDGSTANHDIHFEELFIGKSACSMVVSSSCQLLCLHRFTLNCSPNTPTEFTHLLISTHGVAVLQCATVSMTFGEWYTKRTHKESNESAVFWQMHSFECVNETINTFTELSNNVFHLFRRKIIECIRLRFILRFKSSILIWNLNEIVSLSNNFDRKIEFHANIVLFILGAVTQPANKENGTQFIHW